MNTNTERFYYCCVSCILDMLSQLVCRDYTVYVQFTITGKSHANFCKTKMIALFPLNVEIPPPRLKLSGGSLPPSPLRSRPLLGGICRWRQCAVYLMNASLGPG